MSKHTHKPKTNSQIERELYNQSCLKLLEYLQAKPEKRDTDLARMALKTAELITKREGTELHRQVLLFGIIQAIHPEPEKLAQAAAQFRPDLKKLTGQSAIEKAL